MILKTNKVPKCTTCDQSKNGWSTRRRGILVKSNALEQTPKSAADKKN